jgi:hypothetical protein
MSVGFQIASPGLASDEFLSSARNGVNTQLNKQSPSGRVRPKGLVMRGA